VSFGLTLDLEDCEHRCWVPLVCRVDRKGVVFVSVKEGQDGNWVWPI
jgi:hypothetical protein